jgi:hypothetical protein
MRHGVGLNVVNDDPVFVDFYVAADKAVDLLSVTLAEVLLLFRLYAKCALRLVYVSFIFAIS